MSAANTQPPTVEPGGCPDCEGCAGADGLGPAATPPYHIPNRGEEEEGSFQLLYRIQAHVNADQSPILIPRTVRSRIQYLILRPRPPLYPHAARNKIVNRYKRLRADDRLNSLHVRQPRVHANRNLGVGLAVIIVVRLPPINLLPQFKFFQQLRKGPNLCYMR